MSYRTNRRIAAVISKKAIVAWVFSAIVSVGMLVMPGRALAHDWGDDGGWRHQQHDNGWHEGWSNHRGEDAEEGEEHDGRRYYQQQPYNYGYQQNEDEDEGYGYGNGYNGYGRQLLPRNGQGRVNPRHPGLVWSCDSQGHHCHWARRYGYGQSGVNPYGGYYGNSGYGNSYYRNNGYYGSPLGGLRSLLGIPTP
jgi:hypothetical protein